MDAFVKVEALDFLRLSNDDDLSLYLPKLLLYATSRMTPISDHAKSNLVRILTFYHQLDILRDYLGINFAAVWGSLQKERSLKGECEKRIASAAQFETANCEERARHVLLQLCQTSSSLNFARKHSNLNISDSERWRLSPGTFDVLGGTEYRNHVHFILGSAILSMKPSPTREWKASDDVPYSCSWELSSLIIPFIRGLVQLSNSSSEHTSDPSRFSPLFLSFACNYPPCLEIVAQEAVAILPMLPRPSLVPLLAIAALSSDSAKQIKTLIFSSLSSSCQPFHSKPCCMTDIHCGSLCKKNLFYAEAVFTVASHTKVSEPMAPWLLRTLLGLGRTTVSTRISSQAQTHLMLVQVLRRLRARHNAADIRLQRTWQAVGKMRSRLLTEVEDAASELEELYSISQTTSLENSLPSDVHSSFVSSLKRARILLRVYLCLSGPCGITLSEEELEALQAFWARSLSIISAHSMSALNAAIGILVHQFLADVFGCLVLCHTKLSVLAKTTNSNAFVDLTNLVGASHSFTDQYILLCSALTARRLELLELAVHCIIVEKNKIDVLQRIQKKESVHKEQTPWNKLQLQKWFDRLQLDQSRIAILSKQMCCSKTLLGWCFQTSEPAEQKMKQTLISNLRICAAHCLVQSGAAFRHFKPCLASSPMHACSCSASTVSLGGSKSNREGDSSSCADIGRFLVRVLLQPNPFQMKKTSKRRPLCVTIHPLLPSLVQSTCNFCLEARDFIDARKRPFKPGVESGATNSRKFPPARLISEQTLSAIIQQSLLSNNIASLVITTYYVLYYNEKAQADSAASHRKSTCFSSSLLREVPIPILISHLIGNARDYTCISSLFLSLVCKQAPWALKPKLLIEMQLSKKSNLGSWWITCQCPALCTFTFESSAAAFKTATQRPARAIFYLKHLCISICQTLQFRHILCGSHVPTKPPVDEHQVSSLLLDTLLPILLDANASGVEADQQVLNLFLKSWKLARSLLGSNFLVEALLRIVSSTSIAQADPAQECPIVPDDFVLNPNLVFSELSPNIFMCPILLQVVLDILQYLLLESRRVLQNGSYRLLIASAPASPAVDTLEECLLPSICAPATSVNKAYFLLCCQQLIHKGDHAAAGILSQSSDWSRGKDGEQDCSSDYDQPANLLCLYQEAAMVQTLLDKCRRFPKIDAVTCTCHKASSQILDFVHNLYIDNHSLMKLVHFQTYAVDLLPLCVDQVKSMHSCLGLLDELLRHGNAPVQEFGVHLLSLLSAKYPIPSAMGLARSFILRNCSNPVSSDHVLFRCLDAFVRIAKVFPLLNTSCLQLLLCLKTRISNQPDASSRRMLECVDSASRSLFTSSN